MKLKLPKGCALVISSLLLMGIASAQEIKTSLPLTSVGNDLAWTVGDQNLTLDVPVSGHIRLELYSPRLDQKDYRSDNYYGDEQYDGNTSQVATTFSLLDAQGKVLQTKTYQPGVHNWDTFFDLDLPAGTYQVKASTQGNGKNTFALRLSGMSAAINAENLTVNVHTQEWIAAVNVSTDGSGYALKMYDGDGGGELQARLRDESGNVYPVTVSGDLQWATIPLPEKAGRYTLELRQPSKTKQYSNTVGFALIRQGVAAPITLSKVDETGLLRVIAQLVLPSGNVPTQAAVTLQHTGQTSESVLQLPVDNTIERRVRAGNYAVKVQPIAGAEVSSDKTEVTVPKDGSGELLVHVRPQVALSLQADKTQACIGDVVSIVVRATSKYQGELPLNLQLAAQGLTLKGNQGPLTYKPGENAEWRLEATADKAGSYQVQANLPDWAQSQSADITVLPSTTALQLRRETLPDSRIGDTVTVSLTLTNTAQQDMPFTLTDKVDSGLTAIEPTSFSGVLKKGETRTLSYQAKVVTSGALALSAQLDSPTCPQPQQSQGILNVAAPVPPSEPPSEVRNSPSAARSSTVTLPFDVPKQATELVIAHQPPQDAQYVVGSSRLDGKPLPDPLLSSKGTLYWAVAAQQKGTLSYELSHNNPLSTLPQPALMIRLAGDRSEVLQGKMDKADLQQAVAMNQEVLSGAENTGAIKLPTDKSLIRIRDRITVVVESPMGTPHPTLMINGKAVSDSMLGENTQDGQRNIERLTYVGVPIEVGPNTITFGGSSIEVTRIGAPAKMEVTPVSLVADGSTPVRLKIRVTDAYGNPSTLSAITLHPSLEPYVSDSDTGQSGYQLALKNGEGTLVLQPQSAPVTLDLSAELGQEVKVYHYQVTPDLHTVGVGVVSATLGIHSDFSVENDLTWQARAYSEIGVGSGKLYVAADKDGLPYTDDKSPLERYSVYGDASTESVPLQGIDPIAAVYDHPSYQVAYRRMQMPVDVLPVGSQFTAFTATTKFNPVVSGFVAGIPSDLVSGVVLTPNGSRILRLNPNGYIAGGSELLEVVTYDKNGGRELSRKLLIRNVDYILDENTGIITLVRALDPIDFDFNTVRMLASYRLSGSDATRQVVYGVQIQQKGNNYTVGAAMVHLDEKTTFGVRATYDRDVSHGQIALAYANGVQARADYTTTWVNRWGQKDSALLTARYQAAGYNGMAPLSKGLNLSARYTAGISEHLVAIAEAEYHNAPTINSVTNILTPNDVQGGSVSLRGDYHFVPFSVGAGLKYAFGDVYGIGAVGSVGYQANPFDVDVVHTLPLTGNLKNQTDILAHYRISEHVSLGLKDQITWGVGQAVSLTLDMALGNVNYAIGYDLPNASGSGNRARFGVSTSIALNNQWSLGLHGSALYDVKANTADGALGADLNYKSDNYSATLGSDIVHNTSGWGTVVRGGVTGSLTPNLVLTADGTGEFGAGLNGARVNFGYAYRNRTFNSLGYLRYIGGTLALNEPKVLGGLSAEYRQPAWGVRAGVDTRTLLNDSGSFTAQNYLSGKYYFNDYLAVGAWTYLYLQPSTTTQLFAYGLEGSVRALPGLWLSAGYNLKGFDGLNIPNIYTKQGLYLRLDLTLDESLGRTR